MPEIVKVILDWSLIAVGGALFLILLVVALITDQLRQAKRVLLNKLK